MVIKVTNENLFVNQNSTLYIDIIHTFLDAGQVSFQRGMAAWIWSWIMGHASPGGGHHKGILYIMQSYTKHQFYGSNSPNITYEN